MAKQPKKAPEHLATPLGSCMYCHVMPPKSRITYHKGELDSNTKSHLIQQLAVLSHNNIISYLFTEMLFHMSFSLSFKLHQRLQHTYYKLIDRIKDDLFLQEQAYLYQKKLLLLLE